jgi:hypothetical protein
MRKVYILALTITIIVITSFSKVGIAQTKVIGGSKPDYGYSAIQFKHGIYAVAGGCASGDGDLTVNFGRSDACIFFLDDSLNITSLIQVPGNDDDGFTAIGKTNTNGFIVGGQTSTPSIMAQCGAHSVIDYWVQVYDSAKTLLWQKCYGGSQNDILLQILQTRDGGFLLAGETKSSDGDVIGSHSILEDIWLLKIDSIGNIIWSKCYGSSFYEFFSGVSESDSGEILVAASSSYAGGDVPSSYGFSDYWVFKIDANGNIIWSKTFGGGSNENPNGICAGPDGTVIVVGETTSTDGHVNSFNHGNGDFWLVELDSTGQLIHERCLGGSSHDKGTKVVRNISGNYYVVGTTSSLDGDVISRHPGDIWALELNPTFNILSSITFGGNDSEVPFDISLTDSGYIAVGYTRSDDDDAVGLHIDSLCLTTFSCYDFFVVKTPDNIINSIGITNAKPITVSSNYDNSSLNISLSSSVSDLHIKIYNLAGELVFSEQEPDTFDDSFSWQLSLRPGLYLVNLNCKEGKSIKFKVLIN